MSARDGPAPRLRIGVILASSWRAHQGEGVAKRIHEILAQRPGVEGELLDLRDYHFPAYEDGSPTIERKGSNEADRRWPRKIRDLDGYVVVTPEYNYVYPGQLKNAIDHAHLGWWYKPVAFVCYAGSPAGTRAVEQLRGIALENRMVPVCNEVNIPILELQAKQEGHPTDSYFADTAGSMIDQILWWAQATKIGRISQAPPGL